VKGFPIVESNSSGKNAAFLINTYLQSSLLGKVLINDGADPFDKLPEGSSFNSYEILENNERLLSLAISMEGCGAYCETYTQYFTFDSSTGYISTVNDLFTKPGLNDIAAVLSEKRNQILAEEIESLTKLLTTASKNSEESVTDSATLLQQIEMYESCAAARGQGYFDAGRFYVKDKSVWFVEERCSNHAMRALDDLYEFHLEVKPREKESALTEYGKYVLSLSDKKTIPTSNPFTVFSGNIAGKYPIWFFVHTSEGALSYSYCYKKYGTIINLEKEELANVPAQVEVLPDGSYGGRFYIKVADRSISGTYVDTKYKESKVELSKIN
jgi:hypothetical protein